MVQAITAEPVDRRDVRRHGEEHDRVRRVRRDHAGHRGSGSHLRAQARPHREDRRRRQEGRSRSVKLLDRDERGRLRLSMKALEAAPEGEFVERRACSARRIVCSEADGEERSGRTVSAVSAGRAPATAAQRWAWAQGLARTGADVQRTVLPNGLTVLSEHMFRECGRLPLGRGYAPQRCTSVPRRWASRTCSSTWYSRARETRSAKDISSCARDSRRLARCVHRARAHRRIRRECWTSTCAMQRT